MKSANQIITHIDKVIQNSMPDTAGHAVIVAMTDLIDWIGDCEPVEMEPMGDIRELYEFDPDEAARLQRKYEQEMAEKRADMFEDDYRMGCDSNV